MMFLVSLILSITFRRDELALIHASDNVTMFVAITDGSSLPKPLSVGSRAKRQGGLLWLDIRGENT